MRAATNNPVTQGRHGAFNAVDYSSRPDPIIYAPESGKVTYYGYAGKCGNNLQVQGANGRHGFCHLEKSYVKVGQQVKEGQKLGVMGYTGYTIPSGENGRHLHWVLYRNGKYVYPPNYITKSSTSSEGAGMVFRNESQVKPWYILLRGNPGTLAERKSWVGQTTDRFLSVGAKEAKDRAALIDRLNKKTVDQAKQIASIKAQLTQINQKLSGATSTIDTLTKAVGVKDGEISRLQNEIITLKSKQGGPVEASKWETLKALIRELVGLNK